MAIVANIRSQIHEVVQEVQRDYSLSTSFKMTLSYYFKPTNVWLRLFCALDLSFFSFLNVIEYLYCCMQYCKMLIRFVFYLLLLDINLPRYIATWNILHNSIKEIFKMSEFKSEEPTAAIAAEDEELAAMFDLKQKKKKKVKKATDVDASPAEADSSMSEPGTSSGILKYQI